MINFETVDYYDEDEIEFTESEMRFKSLLNRLDNHIGCSSDYESLVDEKHLSFDEIRVIVMRSLTEYMSEMDDLSEIRDICKWIEKVANQ